MFFKRHKYAYLGKERHIPAFVTIMISFVPAAVTQSEERGIPQVYDIQHNASNGEDGSSNVHKHSEAHLRGKISSIKSPIQAVFDSVLYFN